MALSILQQRFLDNLMSGMSQKEAYIKAGYKARGNVSEMAASRLIRNDKFSQALEIEKEKVAYKAGVTKERILKEEMCLSFLDPALLFDLEKGSLIPPYKLPEFVRRAIVGLEVSEWPDGSTKYKYKFSDKGKSLERLSRHLSLYNDKLNIPGLEELIALIPEQYARSVREQISQYISDRATGKGGQ